MRAMLLSDLISSRSYLLQLLGISAFVAVFVGVMTENLVAIVGCVAAMVPFLYLFSIASCDDQNGWERFRLTMPISRRQVAYGRYASFFVVLMASAIIATTIAMMVGCIVQLLPEGIVADTVGLDYWGAFELLAAGLSVASVILLASALSLPVIIRFGMTRGARFVPVVVVLALSAVVGFFANNPAIAHLEILLSSSESIVLVLAVLVAVVLAIYIASALVSARLYEKREF